MADPGSHRGWFGRNPGADEEQRSYTASGVRLDELHECRTRGAAKQGVGNTLIAECLEALSWLRCSRPRSRLRVACDPPEFGFLESAEPTTVERLRRGPLCTGWPDADTPPPGECLAHLLKSNDTIHLVDNSTVRPYEASKLNILQTNLHLSRWKTCSWVTNCWQLHILWST